MPERPTSTGRLATARTMLRLAWRADRPRSVLAFGLFGLQALTGSLFAWWLKLFLDAVHTADTERLVLATAGLAASLAGVTVLSQAANQVLLALRERAHHLVERDLIELVGRTPTLEIHETPEQLDHLEVLDRRSWQFGEAVPSIVNLFATGVRIATMAALLVSVDPWLLLLPLFGVPVLLLSSKASGFYNRGDDRAAELYRRSGQAYDLATRPGSAKEVRLFRLGAELVARFHAENRALVAVYRRAALGAEGLGLATRTFFLLGYFGALVLVVRRAVDGQASVGDVALTAVLAGQVLGLVGGSAELLQFAWQSLTTASRYVHLRSVSEHARARVGATPAPVPDRLSVGIRLEHVSYRYPHARDDALHEVDLELPAGSTVAIVGDNGAGKTTLVKLLAGLYLPTAGAIDVDGVDLATMDPARWRTRVSAGFQDHARFEFVTRETVGIGHLPAVEDRAAVGSALDRAGGTDVLAALPLGLDTQLGPNWDGGVDLSGGQWQKLALGRAMMRTGPLLLLLDEPTAALDAETEHRLFGRWTSAARSVRDRAGAVTVLVSHRFSTVRMADLIVVLERAGVVEVGTHDQLIGRRGLYAELFELQARSYR